MMNRKKLIIFIFFLFFLVKLDTYAFSGNYNYEVNKMTRNSENGNISISGWGILNAGVDDKSGSPSVSKNSKYGSGSVSSKCTGSSNNYYQYILKAVPLDASKNRLMNKAITLGTKNGSGTSLTDEMCQRNDSKKCVASRSSCYENVGFSFSFNESSMAGFNNGYVFYLTINSMTKGSSTPKKTVSFPLVIYKDRITGMKSSYYDYSNNKTLSEMKVEVIAYGGYQQKTYAINGKVDDECRFNNGETYSVLKTKMYTNNKYYSYNLKVNCKYSYQNSSGSRRYGTSSSAWAPASWLKPPEATASVMETTAKVVEACSDNNVVQQSSNKKTNLCSGTQTFSGDAASSCSTVEYDYYTKKCHENGLTASFSINNLTGGTSFQLVNGGGFTGTADVNTTFTCEYIFNTEKFKQDYELVLNNLNTSVEGSEFWYSSYNTKAKLDQILKSYIDQTKNLASWSSNYDFTKLSAILKISPDVGGEENISLVYDKNDLIHDTIDIDNNGSKDTNYCLVKNNKTLTLNGVNYSVNTDIKCGEKWQVKLSLPTVCLSMKTGEVENCNSSSTQIDGGRKYYIDMNSLSGKIRFSLTGLGYDGKWEFNLDNIDLNGDGIVDQEVCSYNVPGDKILKKQVKFRQIDLSDPFLKTYDSNRIIGKNYSNNKYNFVSIIKEDIWNELNEFNYQYDMSKTNVKAIKKDTKEEGVNSYLGRNCYFDANNNYVCELTRNKNETGTNWFTKAEINE